MAGVIVTGNTPYASEISTLLSLKFYPYQLRRFADGESSVAFEESKNFSNRLVLLVFQFSYCSHELVNDQLFNLLLIARALKKMETSSLIAFLPYLPYARQDEADPITDCMGLQELSSFLKNAGIDSVVCGDIHNSDSLKYTQLPITSLDMTPLWSQVLASYRQRTGVCVVAPDAGAHNRAARLAQALGCDIVLIDKKRQAPNESIPVSISGSIDGKSAIIVDDIIDTGGTAVNAAHALIEKGAAEVIGCFSHALFSANAYDRLAAAPFEKIYVSDTLSMPKNLPQRCQVVAGVNILAARLQSILKTF